MKKIIILLSLFIITSCDYKEINNLIIITGMVIDYKDNNFEVTSQIIDSENKAKISTYITQGSSIEECLKELSKITNKDIFISHLKTLILTKNTIKNKDYQDFFLRDSKSKMNFYIYYVDDIYKDKILNVYKENYGTALYIKDLIEFNNKVFSSSTPVSFLDLIYKQKEYGIDEIYPNLIIKKNNDEEVLYLQNLVVFDKDYNEIILDDKEGIIFNLITNKLEKTILDIPCDKNSFSLSIKNSKTKYKWEDRTFYIKVKVGGILSNYKCHFNLEKPNTAKEISKLANNYIKNNINEIVNISVHKKVDFLGIKNYIYKHDKKVNLEDIDIKIDVKTTISSIGELRK